MSKGRFKPILFSRHFGIEDKDMNKLGVFDPTLNADTLLFPDPSLLRDSEHIEMRAAAESFEKYFDTVRALIAGARGNKTGPAWKAVLKALRFPEIPGTCLGYGSRSIRGSGVGQQTTARLAETAAEIISLGIDDPDLFMAMGLFEEDFGPDLIGDMFTNVCFGHLVEFNLRIVGSLGVSSKDFSMALANGKKFSGKFAANPVAANSELPVILMPKDILRDLPIALDWRGVQEVSRQNSEFRDNLNASISSLWSKKTLESKSHLKTWALSSQSAFGDLLDMIHGMDGKPYDFGNDKLGEVVWRTFAENLIERFPKKISKPTQASKEELSRVVDAIIDQFRYLIEDRDLWKELYTEDGKVRLEKAAQRFLYMTAISYCDANDIDITPEADTGRGPVDYKFSTGKSSRLLVELKLSTNNKIVQGYEKQLQLYNVAEKSFDSRYVIINVGGLGEKLKKILALQSQHISAGKRVPTIVVIDGRQKASASKASL